MRKLVKTAWPFALFAILLAALVLAEWWATRNCCGKVAFAARASCCAAGRDCLKAGFCPAAEAPSPRPSPAIQ